MNGNPNLSGSVPLRADWQKDSSSTAGLTLDWVECGGIAKVGIILRGLQQIQVRVIKKNLG